MIEVSRLRLPPTSMVPKEHGAYGQIAFPLLTALLVAGASAAGLLIAIVGVVTGTSRSVLPP